MSDSSEQEEFNKALRNLDENGRKVAEHLEKRIKKLESTVRELDERTACLQRFGN